MSEPKGYEKARGALGPYKPWICPDCGTEVPSSVQIAHMLGRDCVEVLKEQKADLEQQLEEAIETHIAQGYEMHKTRRWAAAWKQAAKNHRDDAKLAQERIAQLEAALGNILMDMDRAKAEGRQYMPIEDKA